jgi:hypothetical protein
MKAHSKACRQSAQRKSAGLTDFTDLTVLTGLNELRDLTDDAAPAMTGRARKRQLERTVAWTTSERLRCLWYRLRLEMSDYHYAARRVIELRMQLPEDYVRAGVSPPNRRPTARPASLADQPAGGHRPRRTPPRL